MLNIGESLRYLCQLALDMNRLKKPSRIRVEYNIIIFIHRSI